MKLPKKNITIAISWLILAIVIFYINLSPFISVKNVPLQKLSPKKPFIYFPFNIGEWIGKEKSVGESIFALLNPQDILMRRYSNSKGDSLELYFAFFEDLDEKGPHPPEVCWTGTGWTLETLGIEELQINCPECPQALVKKVIAQKNKTDLLLFYLYKINERYFSDEAAFRHVALRDVFIKRRNAAFTLQLYTQVNEGNLKEKEKQLRGFLVKTLSILEKSFLP